MTNAIALARQVLQAEASARVLAALRLTLYPPGPVRAAGIALEDQFFGSVFFNDRVFLQARLCENHLREQGRPNEADRVAAIAFLLRHDAPLVVIEGLEGERLRVRFDRNGRPTHLTDATGVSGLALPTNPTTSFPSVRLALEAVRMYQQAAREDAPAQCPACFRDPERHREGCPLRTRIG